MKLKSLRQCPGIEAVMTKRDGESIVDFKMRCGQILFDLEPAPGTYATGRFTIHPGGRLKSDTQWGQMFQNLPSDTCVIASFAAPLYTGLLAYTNDELAAAPRNPDLA